MRFFRPEMAIWLAAVPAAVILWGIHYRYKWRHRKLWPAATLSRRTTRTRDLAVLLLGVVAIALFAGAMMRPQLRTERLTPVFDKRDLVVILDRSVSMRARDIKPSRAERAIDEIENFLRRKPPVIDRVALVGFSATSVVLSYPTSDIDSLLFYLEWLRDETTPLFGTDMSSALESAVGVIRKEATTRRIQPLFVIVSDGEHQGAPLDHTLATITRGGIHVHTIGIGSDDSVPIPLPVPTGREQWLTDDAGRVLRTRFNERTLQHIAAITGGRYFRSLTGGELRSALDTIAATERTQTGTTSQLVYRDLYLVLLAVATAATVGMATLS